METPVKSDGAWGRVRLSPAWALDHRDLEYINEPFNNVADLEAWRNLGYTHQRFTGDMYDMRFPEPAWMSSIRESIPLKNFAWSVYRMRPGDVLPEHSDTYLRYKEIYDVKNPNAIRRYVIFLEDWQSGHYLEIAGTPVVNWQAGQGVYWDGDTPHLAANMGRTMRYTLQITGTIDIPKR